MPVVEYGRMAARTESEMTPKPPTATISCGWRRASSVAVAAGSFLPAVSRTGALWPAAAAAESASGNVSPEATYDDLRTGGKEVGRDARRGREAVGPTQAPYVWRTAGGEPVAPGKDADREDRDQPKDECDAPV